jgi:hypothetical protein
LIVGRNSHGYLAIEYNEKLDALAAKKNPQSLPIPIAILLNSLITISPIGQPDKLVINY